MRRLDNIDLRLLRIYTTLVEAGSFVDAVAVLNLSQPTLSTHLATLEQRLGERLCERGRRGFRLLPFGETTYKAAKQLFADIDAFNEKGGVAALSVAANSFEVGYSTLGVRAASLVPLDNGMVVIPRASAAWQHAFNSVTPDATVAFQSTTTTFVVAGVPIARDSLLAEAGIDLAISRNATIGVSYTGQIANNVQDHAAKGRFSWKFN